MGEVEYGQCDVCKLEGILTRTYIKYDIKCECCSPNHFELIRHHISCIPEEPQYTRPLIKTENIKKL